MQAFRNELRNDFEQAMTLNLLRNLLAKYKPNATTETFLK